MKLAQAIQLMAEGSAIGPTHRHHAVISPHMKKMGGHTRPEVSKHGDGGAKHSAGHHSGRGVRHSGLHHGKPGGKGLPITHVKVHLVHPDFTRGSKPIRADASASDLASHHTWQEPSASDQTIRDWRLKRVIEKVKKRNLDPFEEVQAEAVTGPCGCTLKLGERVTVEGIGRGKILSRKDRMLIVALDNGQNRKIDQKFVHRMMARVAE